MMLNYAQHARSAASRLDDVIDRSAIIVMNIRARMYGSPWIIEHTAISESEGTKKGDSQ